MKLRQGFVSNSSSSSYVLIDFEFVSHTSTSMIINFYYKYLNNKEIWEISFGSVILKRIKYNQEYSWELKNQTMNIRKEDFPKLEKLFNKTQREEKLKRILNEI